MSGTYSPVPAYDEKVNEATHTIEMNPGNIQETPSPRQPYIPVSTNFVPSILVTLFCFVPFGIVSMVYATLAKDNVEIGKYVDAHRQATRSRYWAKMACIVGTVLIALLVLFQIAVSYFVFSNLQEQLEHLENP